VVIQRVATRQPYVAITVDDFFTADYRRLTAIRLLQAANSLHAQLTLCPAGRALAGYARQEPEQAQSIRQLVAEGNYEFCNHTFSHPVMPKLGRLQGVQAEIGEITKGAAAIQDFFGRPPSPIFRPPFGSWDVSTQIAAATAGYPRIITWSIDSGDSEGPERPADQLVANVACARPGDIILMHANRESSAAALPLIVQMLRQKGLEPVSISTLLASGKPVYTTRPSDMKRLYTCVRPPLKAPPSPSLTTATPTLGRVVATPVSRPVVRK
jgi:peptidoglycan/xylan/chitin deacetylase (PgdA/CDA1 family)